MLTIVEGYEMTGKSTLVRDIEYTGLINSENEISKWSDIAKGFGITTPEGTHGVGYTGSWIIGATVAHLGALGVDVSGVVLDRGILSSIIYGGMKDDFKEFSHLKRYLQDLNYIGCNIIVCQHKDKKSAEYVFNKSRIEREGLEDAYDDRTFDEYWKNYTEFCRRVKEAVELLKDYQNIHITYHELQIDIEEEMKVNKVLQAIKINTFQDIDKMVRRLQKCENIAEDIKIRRGYDRVNGTRITSVRTSYYDEYMNRVELSVTYPESLLNDNKDFVGRVILFEGNKLVSPTSLSYLK